MPDTPIGTDSPNYGPLTSADLGTSIYCRVTATNSVGSANANSNTVGPVVAAPGAYVGPGQVVSGATAYYGLRGYNNTYTGPAIDLHNTSTGAFVATINILSTGALDVATAATHISAGAAKVGRIYDQIGSNHLEETSAINAQRPILVLNMIGTRPALLFTTAQGLQTINPVTRAQPFTVSCYVKITDSGVSIQGIISTGGGAYLQADWGTSTPGTVETLMNAGTDIFGPFTANVWRGIAAVFDGASSDLNVNGTAMAGNAGTNGIVAASPVICGELGSGGLNGHLTEIGIWPVAFSGANSTAMYNNQAAWWA